MTLRNSIHGKRVQKWTKNGPDGRTPDGRTDRTWDLMGWRDRYSASRKKRCLGGERSIFLAVAAIMMATTGSHILAKNPLVSDGAKQGCFFAILVISAQIGANKGFLW